MRYEIRPLGAWLEPLTDRRRGAHLFRASWSDTLDLLERELTHLGASNIVVQVDVQDGQIRRDGMLRATARVGFPGVRLSFASRHGPLTYSTDAYEAHFAASQLTAWQANVRAIALALEALRAVDRYGVSGRGLHVLIDRWTEYGRRVLRDPKNNASTIRREFSAVLDALEYGIGQSTVTR